VKRLRAAILPDLLTGNLAEADKADRWRTFADLYLVQQLHCYPGDYLDHPTPERALETVERYEEDLTDSARSHAPIRAVITVGEAIEVNASRTPRDADPLADRLRQEMEALLGSTKSHRRKSPTGTDL
jgi:hypothetical protein